jgi:hypothetical protein
MQWPWARKPQSLDSSLGDLTAEDLQVLAHAVQQHPEYFQFWIGLRQQRRQAFEKIKLPKTQEECFTYALTCRDVAREIQTLTRIIEMPITALNALERIKHSAETSEKPKADERPWDAPEVPEEDFR